METRICKKCQIDKCLSEYHTRKDKPANGGYRYICKVCACERSKQSYQDNKEKAKARCAIAAKARILERRKFTHDYFSNNSCVQCGESDPVVLEFDHIDPSTKSYTVSQMVWSNCAMKKLKHEIAKCQVLCANCHRRKTSKELGWYAFLEDEENPEDVAGNVQASVV